MSNGLCTSQYMYTVHPFEMKYKKLTIQVCQPSAGGGGGTSVGVITI